MNSSPPIRATTDFVGNALAQSFRHDLEERVDCRVAERVIYLFEPIEVDIKDRRTFPIGHVGIKVFVHEPTIGETSERVMTRNKLGISLLLFHARDAFSQRLRSLPHDDFKAIVQLFQVGVQFKKLFAFLLEKFLSLQSGRLLARSFPFGALQIRVCTKDLPFVLSDLSWSEEILHLGH